MLRLASELRLNQQDFSKRSPLLIAAGLVWIFGAQLWPTLPVVSALVLIGCGASLVLAGGRGRSLVLLNLVVYAMIVILAIAAQWDLALKSFTGRLKVAMLLDHVIAVGLLVVLAYRTVMFVSGDLLDRK